MIADSYAKSEVNLLINHWKIFTTQCLFCKKIKRVFRRSLSYWNMFFVQGKTVLHFSFNLNNKKFLIEIFKIQLKTNATQQLFLCLIKYCEIWESLWYCWNKMLFFNFHVEAAILRKSVNIWQFFFSNSAAKLWMLRLSLDWSRVDFSKFCLI